MNSITLLLLVSTGVLAGSCYILTTIVNKQRASIVNAFDRISTLIEHGTKARRATYEAERVIIKLSNDNAELRRNQLEGKS